MEGATKIQSEEGRKMEVERVRGCLADLCTDMLELVGNPRLTTPQNRAKAAFVSATVKKLVRMEREKEECAQVEALGMQGLDFGETRAVRNKPQYKALR
jgi:hypothetical protein